MEVESTKDQPSWSIPLKTVEKHDFQLIIEGSATSFPGTSLYLEKVLLSRGRERTLGTRLKVQQLMRISVTDISFHGESSSTFVTHK